MRPPPLRGDESCAQIHESKGVKCVSVAHRSAEAYERKGVRSERQKVEGRKRKWRMGAYVSAAGQSARGGVAGHGSGPVVSGKTIIP